MWWNFNPGCEEIIILDVRKLKSLMWWNFNHGCNEIIILDEMRLWLTWIVIFWNVQSWIVFFGEGGFNIVTITKIPITIMITLPETCNAGYDETLLIWNKIVIFGSLVHHYKIASRDISMCENHIPLAIKVFKLF